MKRPLLLFPLMIFSLCLDAQFGTTAVPQPTGSIIFQYDDAGNQVFRGYFCPTCVGRPAPETNEGPATAATGTEDELSGEIHIYPVPVRDVLTVAWTEKVDDLVAEVSLYEQNTVHWKFRQKNLPNLNREIRIDMHGYYMGVYVLTFRLRDGRTISRNITRL
ncbi:hypothetical protein [Chryseobacterium sp. R2A-55]|uniref:hypothetical protein n=1 Tax=Chryseobacterium sp. R2A-55 TaxID=2744445 RepID=UPI001F33FD55|nr:hypothetical protein [Chryseobacterium sp. R2A-55]